MDLLSKESTFSHALKTARINGLAQTTYHYRPATSGLNMFRCPVFHLLDFYLYIGIYHLQYTTAVICRPHGRRSHFLPTDILWSTNQKLNKYRVYCVLIIFFQINYTLIYVYMVAANSVYFKFKITRSRHLETHRFDTIYTLDCCLWIYLTLFFKYLLLCSIYPNYYIKLLKKATFSMNFWAYNFSNYYIKTLNQQKKKKLFILCMD